jgi:hypothetical protein
MQNKYAVKFDMFVGANNYSPKIAKRKQKPRPTKQGEVGAKRRVRAERKAQLNDKDKTTTALLAFIWNIRFQLDRVCRLAVGYERIRG